VFQKKIPWRIFWHKLEEVTAQWIKLHDKELPDFNSLQNIIKTTTLRMQGMWHIEKRNVQGY
jgi:hypothetical protein